jgi:toxin ParE1/3/4
MAFEVVWTLSAERDFEGIVSRIARSRPRTAAKIGRGIADRAASLRDLPFLGAVFPDESRFREILFKKYRIFYRVEEALERVTIVRVWHGARRNPRLP